MNLDNLIKLDSSLTTHLRIAEKPGVLRNIAMFFAHSGDSWFWGVAILLLFFLGNQIWKSRAIILGASVILTAIVVLIIKFTVKRQRPEGNWGNIYRRTDPHSFPSGHAARAFMLAIITLGIGPAWFAIILAVWAPLVGMARVAMGVHFFSDVIAGAIVGIIMGCINLIIVPNGLQTLSIILN
jgi:undecaprenyl-diphosphatase